jgi:hypothetical protein
MNPAEYNKLMEELRTLYKKRDFKTLKSRYLLSRWMIHPEDREKIEKIVQVHHEPVYKEPGEQTILNYAQEKMGGEISKLP